LRLPRSEDREAFESDEFHTAFAKTLEEVRKTTSSWIVHVETLYGRSPGELVTLAKNLADRVSQGLMNKYGCVLGQGEINKRHELGVDDPVAQLLNQYFTVSTPKRVIDDSPVRMKVRLTILGVTLRLSIC